MLWILANQGHSYTPQIFHSFLLENMGVRIKRVKKRVGGEGSLCPMEPGQEFMTRKSDECVIYGAYSTIPPALPFGNEKRLFCCRAKAWYAPPTPPSGYDTPLVFISVSTPCPGASIWPVIGTITPSNLFHLPKWPPAAIPLLLRTCR